VNVLILSEGAGGGGIQQSLQSVSVQLREVQEFDAELAMIRPADRCGLNRDWRSQFRSSYQKLYTGARSDLNRTRDGTAAGRDVEHSALSDVGILIRGEKYRKIGWDSAMFATFNHGGLLKRA
jgi:hypothetical protein